MPTFRSIALLLLLGIAATARAEPPAASNLQAEVIATERAFAKTMADRDHAAFTHFLADDAIFINGQETLHGKAAVADAWRALYAKPEAPFSWEPTLVDVNDDGTLAISRGPVRDRSGKVISGFSSIWRRESPGVWKIIFDQGTEVRACHLDAAK